MFPPRPFHSLPEAIYIVSIYSANTVSAKSSFQECFSDAAEVLAISEEWLYSNNA